MRASLYFKLKRPPRPFRADAVADQWRIISDELPAHELLELNNTLNGIRQANPAARFSQTFPGTVRMLRDLDGPAAGDREIALYFGIEFPEAAEAFEAARELRANVLAESGEILSRLRSTCSGAQVYIERSNLGGVGAIWAWGVDGGDGRNVTICVIDGGWDNLHTDLPQERISYIPPVPDAPAIDHGTNVLGVLVGRPRHELLTGVAHGATIKVSSINVDTDPSTDVNLTLQALDRALASATLTQGDVLLVQEEILLSNRWLPLEASRTIMASFTTAASLGITVVEPAGNSGIEVGDSPPEPPWPSGASVSTTLSNPGEGPVMAGPGNVVPWMQLWPVMVGAGATPQPPTGGWGPPRKSNSNYGERVDCQGWGDCVLTTRPSGFGDLFKYDFGDTSAAASIVAGVIAIMQSTRKAAGMAPLTPYEVRRRLRDDNFGLPQPPADAALWRIGPQPDLYRLLNADFLNVVEYRYPDELMSRFLWVSPWVIPRLKPSVDPGGSPEVIAPGEEGWVYLRLPNESPFDEMVCADLYWAYPGTYLGPSTWLGKSIGQVEWSIPGRRSESDVGLSPGMTWRSPSGTTHPSLIAVLTSRWNGVSLSPHSSDADYLAGLRRHIVHRNVIESPLADDGPCFWRFRLRMPRMALRGTRIKLTADLPKGSRLFIGLPPDRERHFRWDKSMVRHETGALLETRFGANTRLALDRLRKPAGDLVEAEKLPAVWLECDAAKPGFPLFGLGPGEEVPIVIGVDRRDKGRAASIAIDQYVILPKPVERDEPVLIGRLVLATPAAGS